MAEKNKKHRDGIVYSTLEDFKYAFSDEEEAQETLAPNKQSLIVCLDKKARKGKQVTLIQGFVGSDEDLGVLAKELKTKCGVGGSSKDGEIILQGDFIQKVGDYLLEKGYKVKVR